MGLGDQVDSKGSRILVAVEVKMYAHVKLDSCSLNICIVFYNNGRSIKFYLKKRIKISLAHNI